MEKMHGLVRVIEWQEGVEIEENKVNLYLAWESVIFDKERLVGRYGERVSEGLMKVVG